MLTPLSWHLFYTEIADCHVRGVTLVSLTRPAAYGSAAFAARRAGVDFDLGYRAATAEFFRFRDTRTCTNAKNQNVNGSSPDAVDDLVSQLKAVHSF
jgi:hypothetical protein